MVTIEQRILILDAAAVLAESAFNDTFPGLAAAVENLQNELDPILEAMASGKTSAELLLEQQQALEAASVEPVLFSEIEDCQVKVRTHRGDRILSNAVVLA